MACGIKNSSTLDSCRPLIHINRRYKSVCIIMFNLGQPQSPAYAQSWCQILISMSKYGFDAKFEHSPPEAVILGYKQ